MESIPPMSFHEIPATFSSFFIIVGTIPPRTASKKGRESEADCSMEATMACRTNISRSAPEKPRVRIESVSRRDSTCSSA